MPRTDAQILTPLSPAACRTRLQARTRSWLAPHSWVARQRERPVTGKVSSGGFSLAQYGGLPLYAFKPRAIGSFQHAGQGTLVSVRLPVRVLPLILACALAWGGWLALMMTGYGYIVQVFYTHTPPLLMAYYLAANFIPLALICLYWVHRSRRERQFLLHFLRVTLESCDIPIHEQR